MKQKFYLYSFVLLAMFFVSNSVRAQKIDMNTGLVVWKGTTLADAVTQSNNDKYFYLVQYKPTLSVSDPELYINAGGDWGVQGVLNAVGMRMQVRVLKFPTCHFTGFRE